MATQLDSLLIRESSETADERNIMVALTPDQRISFRLKGMKSGHVSIPIKELYEQLTGVPSAGKSTRPVKSGSFVGLESNTETILRRLRTLNATTPGKMADVSRIDELLVDLIDEQKKSS